MNKKLNKNKGITLIALVITIIVMLILVAVTISMAVNGGLFNYAGKATGETQNAINAEQELADGRIKVEGTWYNSIDDYLNDNPSSDQRLEKIEDDGSYVGYYADTNDDGEVDGIIYADLAKGGNGEWGGQTYTIPTDTGFKDYYIVKKDYEGSFGKKDVISTAKETKEETGKERFYVMALTDLSESKALWMEEGNGITIEKGAFGDGRYLTKQYGALKLPDNWFVPCMAEWCAFVDQLSISNSNYETCGLKDEYNVSGNTQRLEGGVNSSVTYVKFAENGFDYGHAYNTFYTRLSTTF